MNAPDGPTKFGLTKYLGRNFWTCPGFMGTSILCMRRGLVPIVLPSVTAAGLKIASRSKMSYLGAVPHGNASRSCWMTHAALGLYVALKCRMRRRPW